MNEKIQIDVIIVSYAQTNDLKRTTEQCVESLFKSENQDEIIFNVIVLESEQSLRPYTYPCTETIYPDIPFGYHKYLSIGIEMTKSPYICLCNNDLIFHDGWATEILKPMKQFNDLYSTSPYSKANHTKFGMKENDGIKLGYRTRAEVAGWCLFVKRELFKLIGTLDRNFIFWYADDDFANTLFVLRLGHVLVTSSHVDHIESKTLKNQTSERELELTEGESTYYKKKWNHRLGRGWVALDD